MPIRYDLPSRQAAQDHFNYELPTDGNKWGIPTIKRQRVRIPKQATLFRYSQHYPGSLVHFYVSDFRFECLWNCPTKYLDHLRPALLIASPDYSLYRDWPLAAQVWNVYRNRWIGAFLQRNSLRVIPSISWSDTRSYDFCFLGVEKGAVISISSVGCLRDRESRDYFERGYREMMKRLEPRKVLWYGTCHKTDDPRIVAYPFTQNGYNGREYRENGHGR